MNNEQTPAAKSTKQALATKTTDAKDQPSKKRFSRGGRNLVLLGIISTIVACLSSGISLAIYHNSGDIYLDRSRPGFIPEEGDDDNKDPVPEVYVFEKTGTLSIKDIEEYLQNLDIDAKALDALPDAFSPDALSNTSLGIPENSE